LYIICIYINIKLEMQNFVIRPTEFLTWFLSEKCHCFPKEDKMKTRPSILDVEGFVSLFVI